MDTAPKIIFLKQTISTVSTKHWFYELGLDISNMLGPCIMYTDVGIDQEIGSFKIFAAPAYSKKTNILRLWSWFRYFVGAFFTVWRYSSKALLFIVAQPPYIPLIGWLRSILFKQNYVVWVDDIYPDAFVRHNLLKADNPVIRIWEHFNRLIFSHSSRVFTLGPCMAQVLSRYLSPEDINNKIRIVPTWVDSGQIHPINKQDNPFAKEYGQIGKLTVLYSGNLGLSHDLNTMVMAARRLSEYKDIHFLIIGTGSQWEQLKKAAVELDNLTLLPYQPVDMLPYSLTTGDIAVISLDRGLEGISMPSKTQFMMAAGSALIGLGRIPNDIQMIIQEYNCGLSLEPGDVDGFTKAVLRFYKDRNYLAFCQHNARAAAESVFSRAYNVNKIMNEIKHLFPSEGE